MGDVSFSISGVVHGDVQQSAGDIHSIKVAGADALDALAATERLRAALATLEISPHARRTADAELVHLESELSSPAPDRDEVARRLERFARLLKAAGGIAAAGGALAGPVGVIAGWLGPLGAAALRLVR